MIKKEIVICVLLYMCLITAIGSFIPWGLLLILFPVLFYLLYTNTRNADANLAENMRTSLIERFIRGEKTGDRKEMEDAIHIWSCVCPCANMGCQDNPQCTHCKSSWGWADDMKEIYKERSEECVCRQELIEGLLATRRACQLDPGVRQQSYHRS